MNPDGNKKDKNKIIILNSKKVASCIIISLSFCVEFKHSSRECVLVDLWWTDGPSKWTWKCIIEFYIIKSVHILCVVLHSLLLQSEQEWMNKLQIWLQCLRHSDCWVKAVFFKPRVPDLTWGHLEFKCGQWLKTKSSTTVFFHFHEYKLTSNKMQQMCDLKIVRNHWVNPCLQCVLYSVWTLF